MSASAAVERVCLAAFGCAATAAFALAYDARPAWALAAACAASALWRLPRVPGALAAGGRGALLLLELYTIGLGALLLVRPEMSAQEQTRLAVLGGFGLGTLSALFLLGGPGAFPPGLTAVPAAVATLVVAAFAAEAPLAVPLSLAALVLAVHLLAAHDAAGAASSADLRPLARIARQPLRVATSLLATGAVALALALGLPEAQERLDRLAYERAAAGSGFAFPADSTLGDLDELKTSERVVLRVFSAVPQRLRARALTRFDGRTWRAGAGPSRTIAPSGAPVERLEDVPGAAFAIAPRERAEGPADLVIATRILPAGMSDVVLVAPARKLVVRAPLESLRVDAHETLARVEATAPGVYGVLHRADGIVVQEEEPPPEVLAECLALPEDTDPRFHELAARLAAGAPDDEERLRRTLAHVEGACAYTLRPGRFATRQPVAEFLFEKRRGYCQYFASAAAILLRLQGIACRYVTGFAVSEENRQGGHLVVRECHAHAWLEAYLPGRGWVEADPTPAAEIADMQARARGGALRDAIERLRGAWAELSVAFRHVSPVAALRALGARLAAALRGLLDGPAAPLLLIGLAGWSGLRLWRRRARAGPARGAAGPAGAAGLAEVPPEATRLLARLDALLARRGLGRPAARAPLEHLASIGEGRLPPDLREAGRRAVDAFYRACFAGAPVSRDEIEELRRALDAAGRGRPT